MVTKTAKKKKYCRKKDYEGVSLCRKSRKGSNCRGAPVRIVSVSEQSAATCMAKIKFSSKVASETAAAVWRSSKGTFRQKSGRKPFRVPAKLVGTVSKAEAIFFKNMGNKGLKVASQFKGRITSSTLGYTVDYRVKSVLCKRGRTRRLGAKETSTRSGVSFGCDCKVLHGVALAAVLSGMPNTLISTQKKCFKEFARMSLWFSSLAKGSERRPPRNLPRMKVKWIKAKFKKMTDIGLLVVKGCEVKKVKNAKKAKKAKKAKNVTSVVKVEKKDNGKEAAAKAEKSKERAKKLKEKNAEVKGKGKTERAAKRKGEGAVKAEAGSKAKYKAQREAKRKAMEKAKRLREGKAKKDKKQHRLAVAKLKKEVEAHVAKEMDRDPSNPTKREAKMKKQVQKEQAKEAHHKRIMSRYLGWEKKNVPQPAV